jgi:hypothetical protein
MNKWSQAAKIVIVIVALVGASTLKSHALPAQSDDFNFTGYKILIGVGAAAVVGITVAVLVHKSHGTHTVTGCVASGPDGINLASEENKHLYNLTGDLASVKSGDRVTLKLKKLKASSPGTAPLWENKKLVKDFGPCHA